MDLNIGQETNPVSGSNQLVGAIYVNSAPTSLIDHFAYPGPYTGQTQTHTFPGLLDVAYRYVCWESPDGSASGTPRNDFVVQPSSDAFQTKDDLYITADLTPTIIGGGMTYGPDPALTGWNWDLERRDKPGTLKCGRDYVKTVSGVDTTQDDLTADGWRIINGEIINNNEDFIVHFQPQLSTLNTTPVTRVIGGIIEVQVTTTLDSTAKGKSILLKGTSAYFEVGMPDIGDFADGDVIYFSSCGGDHINVLITSNNSNNILANKLLSGFIGDQKTSYIILGQNEQISFYAWTDPGNSVRYWVILWSDGAWQRVGEQVLSLSNNMMNMLLLNGQKVSRTNYKRLWDWVNSALDSSLLIDDSVWTGGSSILGTNAQTYLINRGKFSKGDGSTTFGLPDFTLYGFQRLVGIGNQGLFQVGIAETHYHTLHAFGTITGSGGPYYLSRVNGGGYSGGGSNTFGGRPISLGPDTSMRTGKDNNLGADPITGGQFETRPNNFGVYPLIRI